MICRWSSSIEPNSRILIETPWPEKLARTIMYLEIYFFHWFHHVICWFPTILFGNNWQIVLYQESWQWPDKTVQIRHPFNKITIGQIFHPCHISVTPVSAPKRCFICQWKKFFFLQLSNFSKLRHVSLRYNKRQKHDLILSQHRCSETEQLDHK